MNKNIAYHIVTATHSRVTTYRWLLFGPTNVILYPIEVLWYDRSLRSWTWKLVRSSRNLPALIPWPQDQMHWEEGDRGNAPTFSYLGGSPVLTQALWWSKADATTDHPNTVRLIQRHSTNSHRFTCTVSQTSRTMATIGSYSIGTDLPNLWTSTVESTLLTSASSLWTCIIPITFKLWLREPCLLYAIQMHMEILHCIEKSL